MQRKPLEDMTFADDFIFAKVMSNADIARDFLESLFCKQIESIKLSQAQSEHKLGFNSHGARFDVEFIGDDEVYDIEMQQRSDNGSENVKSLINRTRYYQAVLDAEHLKPGQEYKKLPNTYIIFICRFDPFGYGLAQYTQHTTISELGEKVIEGTCAIYLNTTYTTENVSEEIANLLQYVENPSMGFGPLVDKLDNEVAGTKLNPRVRSELMSLYEMLEKERREGRQAGRQEEREECIQRLIKATGCSREKAESILGSPRDAQQNMQRMHLGS